FAVWIVLYYQKQAVSRGGDIIQATVVIDWYVFVLVGVMTFAAGSYLVHKYLTPRIKSNWFLWQFVGLTSSVLVMSILVTILSIDHFRGALPVESFQGFAVGMLTIFIQILGLMIPINLLWAALIKHVPIAAILSNIDSSG